MAIGDQLNPDPAAGDNSTGSTSLFGGECLREGLSRARLSQRGLIRGLGGLAALPTGTVGYSGGEWSAGYGLWMCPWKLRSLLQAAAPFSCKTPPSGLPLKGSAFRSKDQAIK